MTLTEVCVLVVGVLLVLRWRLQRYWGSLPSWKQLDGASIKVGGSAKKLAAYADVDVVVIGSGLGGLTCASILSKGGYRCVVLEQHDVIGGSTHTFEDKGYEFDVGLHYIGGVMELFFSPLRRLWASASDGQLEWTHCDPTYDVAHNSSTKQTIEWTEDVALNNAHVLEAFPGAGAAAALRKYRFLESVGILVSYGFFAFKILPPCCLRVCWPVLGPVWRRFGARTVRETTAACGMTGDLKDLGGCLTYLYGDYGMNPKRAPWFLHALVATHYHGGAYFPTGGCSSIAKTLVAAITRNGGAAFCRAPVDAILVERGRAVGVTCRGSTIRAKYVISDAGFRNTFGCQDLDGHPTRTPLLPADVAAPQRRLLQRGDLARDAVKGSMAMIYVFVGLDASDEALGIRAQNKWIVKDWNHDAAHAAFDALELPEGQVPSLADLPGVFLGSASAKDSDYQRRHPGKAAMVILAIVRPEWFDPYRDSGTVKHRGEAYAKFKGGWRDLLLSSLYEHWPTTKGHVAYTDVGTPLSNDFYLNSIRGEVYALESTADRYGTVDALNAQHPQSTVPGLLLTGQDACCIGIVSALVSGLLTAANVSYVAALRCVLEIILAV